jgi:hypothetical protein
MGGWMRVEVLITTVDTVQEYTMKVVIKIMRMRRRGRQDEGERLK